MKKLINTIKNIEDTKNECILIGYTFSDNMSSFFNKPISSSKLGIVSVTNSYCNNLIQLPITQISCKLIFLKTLDDNQSIVGKIITIYHLCNTNYYSSSITAYFDSLNYEFSSNLGLLAPFFQGK
ncbi:Uncharacterized protein FWK35_00025952 [Aphis craccivora]|uniref:Uncharacterized protein n=1 Tax=Aphis craccivora TaxID=307492 RepID=A0A6G0VVQ1_APHCR|nr:Uncharacterized protein FWK35_00025952 [Aphis craccivora]